MTIGNHTIGVREKRLANDTCMWLLMIESSAGHWTEPEIRILEIRLTDTC